MQEGRRTAHRDLSANACICEMGGSQRLKPLPGRVRFGRIPDVSAASLHGFIKAHVKPGAVVLTDAWQGYTGIDKSGFTRKAVSIRASSKNASELMARVHRVAALLKRWLLATHQGAVQPEQLDYYLDEFTFRFNRRESRARGLLFYRLLHQAAHTAPQPYMAIAGGERPAETESPADHKM